MIKLINSDYTLMNVYDYINIISQIRVKAEQLQVLILLSI